MNNFTAQIPSDFNTLVNEITHIGFKRHAANLLEAVKTNAPFIKKSINALPVLTGPKAKSAIILSAGPSVHRRNSIKRILQSRYKGSIIAVDGCYISCLKAGLIPDFVVSLDPHPTRVVRWFGDPHFEKNSANDDYFARQDLDVTFRKNSIEHNKENMEFINRFAKKTKAIVASCLAFNVVERLNAAGFDLYWWNPLVDNPDNSDSLTKKIHQINKLPCINTGGTVGTAAWVLTATKLKIPEIGLVGMDFGYYQDTPIEKTQTYYELAERHGSFEGIDKYFLECAFPLTGEKFYTDPTYFWYRQNFLDLMKKAPHIKTINCTEGGTLFDEHVACQNLDEFLKKHS